MHQLLAFCDEHIDTSVVSGWRIGAKVGLMPSPTEQYRWLDGMQYTINKCLTEITDKLAAELNNNIFLT